MEVVDSVLFRQMIMVLEAHLEKIIKQLELLRFPVERWHRFIVFVSDYGNL